jgi:cytochrome c peroxidase
MNWTPRTRVRLLAVAGLALIAIGLLVAASTRKPTATGSALAVNLSDAEVRRIVTHSPLPDAPPDPTNAWADDDRAAHFGQFLFFDTRLSANGAVSCATCHDPREGFADNVQFAQGIGTMDRHTQSLFNVAHNRWFFWDGRADTLWAQALEPIENPVEMGLSRVELVRVLSRESDLRRAYETIFGPLPDLSDPLRFPPAARPNAEEDGRDLDQAWQSMAAADREAINRVFVNIGKAIAAYERRIISRDSAFDRFVAGLRSGDESQLTAMTPSQQRGLKLFVGKANCRLCHAGPNFTDGEFHNNGVPPARGGQPRDAGRYDGAKLVASNEFNAAGRYSDAPNGAAAAKATSIVRSSEQWGQFKTPSLRGIALSPPYMHQGQFETLEEVVRYYSTLEQAVLPSHHQEQLLQPLGLTEREIDDLVAFLRALSGAPLDRALLHAPDAPLPK